MAATLDTVTEKIKEAHGENKSRFDQVIAGQDEQIRIQNASLRTLRTMLDISADALMDAREAAREAARISDDDGGEVPDAKAEEAKAGGFFSKMGRAIMNPVKALGSGMKSAGKGIGAFLKGLSSGLASFANPMVLIGVTVMSVSLPIFAAGLAAAFKVFSMIAGEGKALALVTTIIESLGEAIGTILMKILEGFGNMVKNMGPFITTFFKGIAHVIKALEPIIVSIWQIIKDIITDPVLNKTIQKVLDVLGIALQELSKIIQKTGDVIISIMENIGGIIDSVGNAISGIFESIGTTIETVLNAIGDNIEKVGKTIEGIIGTIGDTVTQIIDSIVGGIERLAGLDAGNMGKVGLALAALAGGLVLFSAGAAIAGGVMPSSEDLDKISTAVKKFADLEPGNLAQVGEGMQKVGLGLAIFGGGSKVAELLFPEKTGALDAIADSVKKFGAIDGSNFALVGDGMKKLGVGLMAFGGGSFIGDLAEGFGKLVGASDPVDKFKRFAEIDGPALQGAAVGITVLAKAMNVLGDADIEKTAEALDDFMDEIDMDKLKEFSKATEGMMTGKMLAELQIQANQARGAGTNLIVNNNTTQLNQNGSTIIPAPKVEPGTKEATYN